MGVIEGSDNEDSFAIAQISECQAICCKDVSTLNLPLLQIKTSTVIQSTKVRYGQRYRQSVPTGTQSIHG